MPSLHLSTFKYPLGIIRVIEFLFIVIAIAAVNSWNVKIDYPCPQHNTTMQHAEASTFTLSNVEITSCKDENAKATLWQSANNAGGSAGFFYFVNVTALIYVIGITFVYVVLWDKYQEEKRIALADLALTALFFILFFFCSSIWWAGCNTLGHATSEDEVTRLLKENDNFWKGTTTTSGLETHTSNGKLTISVLCDWVCVFSFALNCWFIWKEVVPRNSENPSSIA